MDTHPQSQFTPTAQGQLVAVGQTLAGVVRDYFKNPKHRRAFEEWYYQKYGTTYTWTFGKEQNK